MVAYTKPQQRKKEESERLRGESDQFIDLGFERWTRPCAATRVKLDGDDSHGSITRTWAHG